jgi:hypothetical protein
MGIVKAVFLAVAEDHKFRTDHFKKRIAAGTLTTMMGGNQQIALQSTLLLHGQSAFHMLADVSRQQYFAVSSLYQ